MVGAEHPPYVKMPRYNRNRSPGGTYFFTVVTYRRQPLFGDRRARAALREAVEETRANHPFDVVAWTLLPDHLHTIWKLPDGDSDYSTRWRLIKSRCTRSLCRVGALHPPSVQSRSRQRHGEQPVWQRRFWEHTIRDEEDLRKHIIYVHYNAVKHGLVEDAHLWPFSTIHRYDYDKLTGSLDFDEEAVSRMECE